VPRAITFAPDVRDRHLRDTAFGSTRARTLEIFADVRGIGFAPQIAETPSGYNLFNRLKEGCSLGVSAELCDVHAQGNGVYPTVTRAELRGLAVCEVAAAIFPQLRCWLCSDDRLVDPQAAALTESFMAPRRRAKPHQIVIPPKPAAFLLAEQMGLV